MKTPYEFEHKPRGWFIQLGYSKGSYTLAVNGIEFGEMAEAPARERAALARSAISTQMDGPKK